MKTLSRDRRHARVRARIQGTAKRPRLLIFRGSKTMSLQLIDDAAGRVLKTVTNQQKGASKAGIEAATKLGTDLAKAAKTAKISTVVFDRAGYQYHGNVQAAVEAVRKEGIKV